MSTPTSGLSAARSERLEQLRASYEDFFVVVSPPRAASTALARVFWEHPAIGYYAHEPFDSVYYNRDDLDAALRHIAEPLVLRRFLSKPPGTGGGILVKEMTFQVGRSFEYLACLANRPIVFLLRDPRLSVFSRLKYRAMSGHGTSFPLEETGWRDLAAQVEHCERRGIPYLFVDSAEFRKEPRLVLGELFARLGLPFHERQLCWQALNGLELGNLAGEQTIWYERVLSSTGVEAPDETIPDLDVFDRVDGLRSHVEECLEIYEGFTKDPRRVGGQAAAAGMLALPSQ